MSNRGWIFSKHSCLKMTAHQTTKILIKHEGKKVKTTVGEKQ